jgi:hypothetical protein
MIADILSLTVEAPVESEAPAESTPEPEVVEASDPEPASEPPAAGKLFKDGCFLFWDRWEVATLASTFSHPCLLDDALNGWLTPSPM